MQLPEPVGRDGYESLASVCEERLRRAGAKIKADHPDWQGDTGFRVFKLDTSNIRAWNPDPEQLEQSLFAHREPIRADRSEADLVYELLLKLGLDLCVPMTTRTLAGKTAHAVGGGVLLLCLAEAITAAEVEALASGLADWHAELAPAGEATLVFRDSAFADDVAKANLAAILAQRGLTNVRSL